MRLEFPREEYERRCRAAQAAMRTGGFDALFLSAEANLNYFAGHRHFAPWTTFTRPELCLVPASGDPTLIVHAFLEADTRRDSWITDVRSYMPLTGTPVDLIREIVEARGLQAGRWGAELGSEQRLGLPYQDFVALQKALPRAAFADASDLLWRLRVIKSPAEVVALKEAGRIAAQAFDHAFSSARAGMTEKAFATLLAETIVRAGAEVGFIIATSGPGNYDRVAGMATDRALQRGDMIWVDLGVVFNGYWSDHCRAAVVGPPSDAQQRNWDQIVQVTRKGVETVRAGVPVTAVVEACNAEAKRLGLEFTFAAGRMGHGMGLMSTEPPHVAAYDSTVLEPGMVVSVEPGWVLEHGAYICEKNVVVTPAGCEQLTITSRALRQIPA
jgi:Xaa-Pro aminopeptidase